VFGLRRGRFSSTCSCPVWSVGSTVSNTGHGTFRDVTAEDARPHTVRSGRVQSVRLRRRRPARSLCGGHALGHVDGGGHRARHRRRRAARATSTVPHAQGPDDKRGSPGPHPNSTSHVREQGEDFDALLFGNALYRNLGHGKFAETAVAAGLETLWPGVWPPEISTTTAMRTCSSVGDGLSLLLLAQPADDEQRRWHVPRPGGLTSASSRRGAAFI